MDIKILSAKFESLGARVKVREERARHPWDEFVRIDIRRDAKGEYFDLSVSDDRHVALEVIDARPSQRHLLLMRAGGREGPQKFLCGHDERHWFVAAIPESAGASNVVSAMEALKPPAVHESLARHRVRKRDRNKRRNDAFVRQGEWFFIPQPDLRVNMRLVLQNEPIRRGAGKPHFVQYLYRTGGQVVYVSRIAPNGLTEAEHRQWLKDHPDRKDVRWTVMRRDATAYARGKVRHPDHATIDLKFWHRIEMNTETKSRAMQNVAFLD